MPSSLPHISKDSVGKAPQRPRGDAWVETANSTQGSLLRLPPIRDTLAFSRQALQKVGSMLSSPGREPVKQLHPFGRQRGNRGRRTEHDDHFVAIDVMPDVRPAPRVDKRRRQTQTTSGPIVELTRIAIDEADKAGMDVHRALGLAPLQAAAHSGDLGALNCLLGAGAKPGEARDDGLIPLHFAAQAGNAAIALALIQAGSPVVAKGPGGFTPLHDAASGGHVKMVEMLLERQASADSPADDGATPLHCAAQRGHAHVVAFLLLHGASHSTKSSGGFTPLHDAAYCNHLAVARVLLDCGARLMKSADGATPLHLAAKAGHRGMVALLSEYATQRRAVRDHRKAPMCLS